MVVNYSNSKKLVKIIFHHLPGRNGGNKAKVLLLRIFIYTYASTVIIVLLK